MNEKMQIFDNYDQIVEKHLEDLLSRKTREKDLSYAELIGHLPRAIQENIVNSLENLKPHVKEGQEHLDALVEEIRKKVLLQYEKRFNLPNKEFGKQKILDLIFKLLARDPKPNELKKIAHLSFDVNGLKKVNDSNSHEKGDKYLAAIAGVFKDEGSPAFKFLKNNGIQYLVTDDGGDEFGVIIWSDSKEIGEEIINQAIELFSLEMDKLDVGDCLNLSDRMVLMKFFGITEDDPKKEAKLAQAKSQVPENFYFSAIASGGGANLYKSYYEAIISGKAGLGHDYNQQVKAMMGSLFDISDKEMQAEKEKFKIGLENSVDPMERFLFKIYTRIDNELKLKEEIARLKREVEELKGAEKN